LKFFALKLFLKLLCSHISPQVHSQPFSRNWPTPWKERKPEAMTFSSPCEDAEKDEGTHFQSVVHFNKEAQLVCV
jgi:hypothetical protein